MVAAILWCALGGAGCLLFTGPRRKHTECKGVDATSGGRPFAERLDCFLFVVVNLKHGDELRDLKQIAYTLCEVRQLDGSAGGVRRGEERDQGSQPARVDIVDAAEIKHDAVVFGDQLSYRVAEHS